MSWRNIPQVFTVTNVPANKDIRNGIKNGARIIVAALMTVARGTSPFRSPAQTSAMPAQGTTPMRIRPVARSIWADKKMEAKSQHRKGAKRKFKTNPKENPFQSLAAVPRLLKVMVKPIAAIIMMMSGVLN